MILDTTVLVDAERGGPSLGNVIEDGDDVAIAALTAAELRVGVHLAGGQRRERRASFVEAILNSVTVEIYDLVVAEAHALLLAHVRKAGRPRGVHDLIIAATACARGREVLTLDGNGFKDLPGVALSTRLP